MLAICFGCNKLNQYVYGKDILIHGDHRPLETILRKPIGSAPPRLQRMMLQLQRYNLNVKYLPGKLMYAADTLSRAYIEGESDCGAPDDANVMVHILGNELDSELGAQSMTNVREATAQDKTLNTLSHMMKHGFPRKCGSVPQDIQPFWNIRHELHEADGVLCAGNRIIIPNALKHRMVNLIHESHLG